MEFIVSLSFLIWSTLIASLVAFWWGGDGFGGTDTPYRDFNMVVRGYDPAHRGVSVGNHVATIDGGCGWGGTLNAACLAPDGNILEWIEA